MSTIRCKRSDYSYCIVLSLRCRIDAAIGIISICNWATYLSQTATTKRRNTMSPEATPILLTECLDRSDKSFELWEEKGNRDSASSGDELLHVLPIKNESFLTVGNCHSQQKLGLALISTHVLARSRPAVLHLLLAPTLACISREHIREETRTTIDNIVNRSTRDSMPMTTTKGIRMRTITIGC